MYAFTYHRPKNLAEAAEQFGAGEDAAYVSGGHTLIPAMKSRLSAPSDLVDLSKLADLKGIQKDGDQIVIGAAETHAAVAANSDVNDAIPALAALAGSIGDVQVRYRGTMGGLSPTMTLRRTIPRPCWRWRRPFARPNEKSPPMTFSMVSTPRFLSQARSLPPSHILCRQRRVMQRCAIPRRDMRSARSLSPVLMTQSGWPSPGRATTACSAGPKPRMRFLRTFRQKRLSRCNSTPLRCLVISMPNRRSERVLRRSARGARLPRRANLPFVEGY